MENKVKVTRIGHGQHSIVKVCCLDYNRNITYQGTYLATSTTFDDPRSETLNNFPVLNAGKCTPKMFSP